MLIDFHSHYISPDSVICTADASEPGNALLRCAGLLPDRWTAERQQKLFGLLENDTGLHLGEVGLDRRFEDILPMESQISILREELEFAIRKNRSISLHCVHATKPMLGILGELKFRPFSILWHGFSGSPETARELAKINVMLSIGPRFNGDIGRILDANPYTVPETDYEGTDDSEHLKLLEEQYLRFPEGYPGKAMDLLSLLFGISKGY